MVNMMREDQIRKLPPESRIKNCYESLYYQAKSGDPESDEVVRNEIQRSFRQHDVTLSDRPNNDTLRGIMIDAYKKSAQEIAGNNLPSESNDRIARDFDSFIQNHPKFYTSTFKSFEKRYKGESVDFFADYDRYLKGNPTSEPTEAELDALERDKLKQFSRDGEMKTAGLSYTGSAPGITTHTRRSYQQIKKEEIAAQELKGHKFDKSYDLYIKGRQKTYQKTTAGDSYGFDEREDDGPEL